MVHVADSEENKIINEICVEIVQIIRRNGNAALSAIISVLIDSYQIIGHDKDRLLKDISESWDFYEKIEKTPPEPHLKKRGLVEQLFESAKRKEKDER